MPISESTDAEQYGRAISLGATCEVAYNLRRYYSFKSAYPFDWWITPVAGLLKFLSEPNIELLYAPENLVVSNVWGLSSIRNEYFGIWLHHEFHRQSDGSISNDWHKEIPAAKSRTAALLQKFFGANLLDERILMVRAKSEWDDPAFDPGELRDVLRFRFKNAVFQMIFINYPRSDLGWARSLDIPKLPGADWRGDASAWDRNLADLGYRLSSDSSRVSSSSSMDEWANNKIAAQ